MSTRISGRTAAAHQNDHPAVNAKRDRKKDRSSLCTFTFADGRRCRSPRHSSTSSFCFLHARKEAQARAAEDLGHDISYFFSGHYLSACDLSIALGRVFAATAQGQIKRKTAATLAFLGQVLVQTIRIAEHEYCNAFEPDAWRAAVRRSVNSNSDYLADASDEDVAQPASSQTPEAQPPASPCGDAYPPGPVSPPSPSAVSPEPSPSVEAGLQPGSSPQPTASGSHPQPSPQTAPPQSPAPPPTRASDPQTQTSPAPSTNPATSGPAPASAPPPQPIPAHVPPGFGAPANWDVLMPSKPAPRQRRRIIPSGLLPI